MKSFYLKANYQGRKTPLRGGPKKGGMKVAIYAKIQGEAVKCLEIDCYDYSDSDEIAIYVTPQIKGFTVNDRYGDYRIPIELKLEAPKGDEI